MNKFVSVVRDHDNCCWAQFVTMCRDRSKSHFKHSQMWANELTKKESEKSVHKGIDKDNKVSIWIITSSVHFWFPVRPEQQQLFLSFSTGLAARLFNITLAWRERVCQVAKCVARAHQSISRSCVRTEMMRFLNSFHVLHFTFSSSCASVMQLSIKSINKTPQHFTAHEINNELWVQ